MMDLTHDIVAPVNRHLLLIYIVLQVFKQCHMHDDSGNFFELSLVSCKCIGAYVRNKKNQNQVQN